MEVSGTAATVDLTGRSDARLVALVRAGEDEAFEELYRRYEERIRRFIASRVGDVARAEELAQEAFLSALRGLRASDAAIAWRPWLYEIARNATIDFHRRRASTEELSVDHAELMRLLDTSRAVASRTPDAELEAKERFNHLRGAFDELSAKHHEVLVLREFEGLSYDEIAKRLNLTHGAVESKLFRARRRLEHEFEELSSGRRCVAARATVALLAEGVEVRSERRRLARHARRCAACRRYARDLGVDPLLRRQRQSRFGALLPFGWVLRRCGFDPQQQIAAALIPERATALLAAGAVACAGCFAVGRETANAPAPAHAPAAVQAKPAVRAERPSAASGALGARIRATAPQTAERAARRQRPRRRAGTPATSAQPPAVPARPAAPRPSVPDPVETSAPEGAEGPTLAAPPPTPAGAIRDRTHTTLAATGLPDPPPVVAALPVRLPVLSTALRHEPHE
ncbi:MAG TPA: sigma-70 family RNA polymerase sigma factor [Thermoleophilaceae bacterium]|nr:sigma-70 family RNA polymerase sigma factor [Thermoleophilaceae bacterium]